MEQCFIKQYINDIIIITEFGIKHQYYTRESQLLQLTMINLLIIF